jgi:Leucine rich repeat
MYLTLLKLILTIGKNKLTYIPGAIGNLQSLRELNLSGNELSYLPHTIFDLECLQHLRLHPNPFLAPPDSYSPLPTPPSSQVNVPAVLRAYICPEKPLDVSFVPSLVEFASRELARNFILTDIERVYELPEILRNKALHAGDRFKWDEVCGVCASWYVDEPFSEGSLGCIEWHDALFGNDTIPIWRGMCSWRCVVEWKKHCDAILKENDHDDSA